MGVVRQHLLYIQMKPRRAQRPGTQRRGPHKLAPSANGALALIPIDPSCLYSLSLSRCMLTMPTTSEACAITPKVGQAHQQRTSATIQSMWFRPGACSMHSPWAPPLSLKFLSLICGSSGYHGTDRRLETGQTQCRNRGGQQALRRLAGDEHSLRLAGMGRGGSGPFGRALDGLWAGSYEVNGR